MFEEINVLVQEAVDEISIAKGADQLETLRVKYLGRKARLNQLFSKIASLEQSARKDFGKELNRAKETIAAALREKSVSFGSQERKLDMSFPAASIRQGRKHVISSVNETICDIFEKIGFCVIEGGEVEDEWHNFTALNIPLEHPSREAFDTFYLDMPRHKGGQSLLRSHTSPSQIRVMQKHRPPLAVISPGRVYRPDKVDASHSFMFHQIEGFCVDTAISFSQLKGALLYFARSFFAKDVVLRFRPHFFPFTEPSAEVDIQCMICRGKGCSMCSQKGWLEILGCGMIHPKVLSACGIDEKKYSGFAFGMGVERIAILKYGIKDIRLFTENDVRFLNQFYEV